MLRKFATIVFIALIQIPSLLAAVNYRDTLDVYPFDPVVVTGTRGSIERRELPATLSVVSLNQTTASAQHSLLQVINSSVPGLFVTQRTNVGFGVASGSAGNVTLRGLGAYPNTQVLILIDGRPDVMGLFGHPLSDVYNLQNVERVEVIRGPASLLYGSNAMGGAINIVTKHGATPGWHGNLALRYGSFQTRQFDFQQSFGGKKLFWRFAGGYQASEGWREKGRDDYTNNNGNITLRYYFRGNGYIDANTYFTNLNLYDPGQYSNPFEDHHFDIKRRGGDLTMELVGTRLTTHLKLHHNQGHHLIHDPGFYESFDHTTGAVATVTYRKTDRGNYSLSGEWRQYGGKAYISSQWKKEQVVEYGGVFQGHQHLGNALIIDGGLRLTKHSYTDLIAVPVLGLVVKLPQDLIFRTQYSTGYRVPTINELFLFPPSNTKIKNEYTRSGEASLEKQLSQRVNLLSTIYYSRATNLIEKNPVQIDGQTRRIYQNTGTVTIKGLEIEGQIIPAANVRLNLNYSLTQTSRVVSGTPEQKVGFDLLIKSVSWLTCELQGQWVNGLYAITNPYSSASPTYGRLPGFLTCDARATWHGWRWGEFQLEVKNLTNTRYMTVWDFPLPGRYYNIGFNIKF